MDFVGYPVIFICAFCFFVCDVIYHPHWSETFRIVAQFLAFCAFLSSGGTFMLFGPVGCTAFIAVQSSRLRVTFGLFFFFVSFLLSTCQIFFSSSVSGDSFSFSYMYSCIASVMASMDMSLFLIFFSNS